MEMPPFKRRPPEIAESRRRPSHGRFNWNLLIFLFFKILFICTPIFPREIQDPQNEGKNIVIRNHEGNIRQTNSEGGFIIDQISGNAEFKAAGSIKIGRIDGNLTVATSAGDIEIHEVKGNVSATTQAGNINIEKAARHVFAQAELGEIIIHNADSAEIQNIFGGDVKLFNINGRSKVTTKGNILLIVPETNTIQNICSLSSTDGDITIYLPEGTAADIEIQTPISEDPKHEFRIESDFSFSDFRQKYNTGNLVTLTTKINNGGRKIVLFIEKGIVYFKALKPEEQRLSGS
jgi:hypothetical protein